MNLLAKFKETCISVVPILIIVLILEVTVAPIGLAMVAQFFFGGLLIIVGLSVFLLGIDIGVLHVGQKVGAALVYKRNLPLMLVVGFTVGFFITVAEPDVRVLADQAATIDPSISKTLLVVMISLGVALFVAVSFARTILGVPYPYILVVCYVGVFLLASFTDPAYLGIGFDAGGATTGPMTVPFIMAMGVGVAAVRKGTATEEDSFGLVGLASIGPIAAVLIMGIINKGRSVHGATEFVEQAETLGIVASFIHLIPETLADVAKALGPLAFIFVVFQMTLLHMPPHLVARTIKGLIYTFLGLVIFFIGVNGGFLPVGSALGRIVGGAEHNVILIPIGFVLGAVVVLAEPAIWVLNNQVEEVSGGSIKKEVMLVSLSFGVAVAIALAMVRVVTGMSIWWLLIPGYAVALALTFWAPPLFTAIAFDSGGVASGPMSSTFILSFTLGASNAAGGAPITDAFGVIAMIAMTPLITIQLMGLVFKYKEKKLTVLHDKGTTEERDE
jgi:hypothetical protein